MSDSPLDPAADSAGVETKPATPAAEQLPPGEFCVVGIGASAGGLTAISDVLKRLPFRVNLGIVVVQHLDPEHESLLVELLNRVTSVPVQWAANGQTIEAGNIYVAPPRTCLSVEAGVLRVGPTASDKRTTEIDYFFRELAGAYKHRAVAVLLSGNGVDGSIGAKAVKEQGGIVFAQAPETAEFRGMPGAAIDAGSVDRVLPPAGIAEELIKVAQQASNLWKRMASPDDAAAAPEELEHLATIFRILAARTGVDFSDYKQTTIKRRIARHMMLSKARDLGEFVAFLQKNHLELDKLYESLVINVTEFFRDGDYFEFLRGDILPQLMAQKREEPLRLWIPGCSTGEEAYSFAILLRELMEERGEVLTVQIFGTDVSDRAISHARTGFFLPVDVANVTPERLKRFFYKTDHGYVVQKSVRDMCIFARQNVIKDSRFSRIDLISCRNLLIYFNPKLQRKLMAIFHYALNPAGHLVLGSSESIGSHADLYRLVDRRFRIYSRKSTGRRASFEFASHPSASGAVPPPKPTTVMPDEPKQPFDIIREADRIVLTRHGPTGVLVNDELDILQFRGDVSPYLSPSAGRASLNLLKMARQGLVVALQAAVQEAREKHMRVRRPNVLVTQGETARSVDIDITPVDPMHTKEHFYLVLFAPSSDGAERAAGAPAAAAGLGTQAAQFDQLRQDLQATRNYLQATIEKHEATNQELRAANEEIQSSNEELQSTNEELETAKEELQSTNEELTTVNEELHSRQLELIQLNNDLTNLINSVHLPIIILGQDMRIRRFTPMAERVLNVIPTDIGRPLSDININLEVADLPRWIAEVVDSLTMKEIEVQDRQGRWYLMRLRPYKTADNKTEGVVLTLMDIDQMKRAIADLEEARNLAQLVIERAPEPLVVLTSDFRIKSANHAFARLFQTVPERLFDRPFFEIVRESDGAKELRELIERILPTSVGLTDYEARVEFQQVGPARLLISARQIVSGSRSYPLILLSVRTTA